MFPGKETRFKIFSNRIIQEGPFDINLIYKTLREWFERKKYEYTEVENTTNFKPKGAEIKVRMRGEKEVTDYYKFTINVNFLILETEKVKIKDKVLDLGKMEVRIETFMEVDYRKKFQKSRMGKFIRFIYNNYIIKDEIQSVYGGKSYEDGMDLFETLKDTIGLYTK
ncbi:MAG: hypothetical protein QW404_02055 [Candidatus Nanoarchaeia archaeon]